MRPNHAALALVLTALAAVVPLHAQELGALESKQVMTYSSQLANPALYGALSALTLGLYPSAESFGRDVAPRASGNSRWPADAGELLRPVAQRSFILARTCTWAAMVIVSLCVLRNRRRRSRAALPSSGLSIKGVL